MRSMLLDQLKGRVDASLFSNRKSIEPAIELSGIFNLPCHEDNLYPCRA